MSAWAGGHSSRRRSSQQHLCAQQNQCLSGERRAFNLRPLPATFTEARLLARIDALNQDPTIHGILVQLPLPSHFNRRTVINAISPDKDVDGLHTMNAGALMSGAPRFLPCTPAGVMRMLAAMHIPLEGSQAVVIGCSE